MAQTIRDEINTILYGPGLKSGETKTIVGSLSTEMRKAILRLAEKADQQQGEIEKLRGELEDARAKINELHRRTAGQIVLGSAPSS